MSSRIERVRGDNCTPIRAFQSIVRKGCFDLLLASLASLLTSTAIRIKILQRVLHQRTDRNHAQAACSDLDNWIHVDLEP